jgi:hypothetical protein
MSAKDRAGAKSANRARARPQRASVDACIGSPVED